MWQATDDIIWCMHRSSVVLARELDQGCVRVVLLLMMTLECFKFCPFLNNQDLHSHAKWSVSQQAPQVKYLLPPLARIKGSEIKLSVTVCSQLSDRHHTLSPCLEHLVMVLSSICEIPFEAKSSFVSIFLQFCHHHILSSGHLERCHTLRRSHFRNFPTRMLK